MVPAAASTSRPLAIWPAALIGRPATRGVCRPVPRQPPLVRVVALKGEPAPSPAAQGDELTEGDQSELVGRARRALSRRAALALPCAACAALPGATAAAEAQQPWSDARFAQTMRQGMADYERRVVPIKEQLFAGAGLRDAIVAEVGLGTGPSLAYYKEAGVQRVVGVEPNLAMHPLAAAEAERLGLPLELVAGFAEALPLGEGSVDVVVGTMLLCSVGDVAASTREIRRVLRPGGRYVFMEHVAAPSGSALRAAQHLFDPLQVALACGCHLTRDPSAAIASAGFGNVTSARFSLGADTLPPAGASPATTGGWRPADGPPQPHFLLSPHLAGIATKAHA